MEQSSGPAVAPVRRRGIFYGWWVVTAATITSALSAGAYFQGFSAFFLPLLFEFGGSRTALSFTASLARVETGLMGPITGYLTNRFGPRRVMLAGAITMGLGYLILSRVSSVGALYAVYVPMVALGANWGFGQPAFTAVANWFIRKRGMAIGIAVSGTGIGSLLVSVVALLIQMYGWRATMIVLGFAVWTIGIPMALVMRHRPEQYGMLPDGDTPEQFQKHEREASAHEVDFTAKQALRTPAFWLLAVSFALRNLINSSIGVHFIPAMEDKGFSISFAALMLGMIGVVGTVGRLGTGFLGDRLERRYIISIVLAMVAISMFFLSRATQTWEIILFVLLFAPAQGGAVSEQLAIRGEYFGRRSFGTIGGLMSVVQLLGALTGPIYAGYIHDVTGSYSIAFATYAATTLVAVVTILLAKRPKPPAQPASAAS